MGRLAVKAEEYEECSWIYVVCVCLLHLVRVVAMHFIMKRVDVDYRAVVQRTVLYPKASSNILTYHVKF